MGIVHIYCMHLSAGPVLSKFYFGVQPARTRGGALCGLPEACPQENLTVSMNGGPQLYAWINNTLNPRP